MNIGAVQKFTRAQLLNAIYKNSMMEVNDNFEYMIADAFLVLMGNWEYDKNEAIVARIMELFNVVSHPKEILRYIQKLV